MGSDRPVICVIDDDREVCDLLRLILETRDYQCITCYDGTTGLEAIRRNKPDAIVLDIMMPGINGYDLLIQLRRDPLTADIPIMVVTGVTSSDRRSPGEWKELLEVQGFLAKPLEAGQLLASVQELLAGGERSSPEEASAS